MKILLIGASGTIGKRIYDTLSKKHEVIKASRSGEDVSVDITSAESIEAMYKAVPNLDAVICAAGPAKFGPLTELTEEDFYVGIRGKMMGQVNLVRIGQHYLNDRGSFTLTTGILSEDPIFGSSAVTMINGAVNSFAIAAAQELPRGAENKRCLPDSRRRFRGGLWRLVRRLRRCPDGPCRQRLHPQPPGPDHRTDHKGLLEFTGVQRRLRCKKIFANRYNKWHNIWSVCYIGPIFDNESAPGPMTGWIPPPPSGVRYGRSITGRPNAVRKAGSPLKSVPIRK